MSGVISIQHQQDCVVVDAYYLPFSNKKSVIHVLHVDDDSSLQEITKLMLIDLDNSLEIENACCVDEAFQKLAVGHYDVVVSDYDMPQKNGLQFLKELREQKNDIPFILFTGKGREEVAIKALNLSADGYFNKQGNPETVYGELEHGIQLSVARRKAEGRARRNEQERIELLTIMSDVSNKANLSENLDEICMLACSKIKNIIGRGYVAVSLMDEDEQSLTIRATEGFGDKGMVNSAIRNLGGDPRGMVYYIKDMLPRELEQFRSGKLELIADGLHAVMTRRYPKVTSKLLERLMGIRFVFTVGFIHKNCHLGGAIIMLDSADTLLKNKNLIETLMGQVSPVVSRFFTELKLRESEKRHRVISSLIADVAFSCTESENGTFAFDWITGATERVFGYSPEEIKKRRCWKFAVDPRDLPIFEENVTGISQGQSSTCQLRIIHADGSTRWTKLSLRAIKEGETPKNYTLFGAVEDITERKSFEQRSEAENALIQEVVNSTGSLIFSVDRNYCYTSFNRAHALAMKTIFGADIQMGKSILGYMNVSIDREKAKQNIDKALAGEQLIEEASSGEEKLSRKYFIVTHNPVRNAQSEVTGVVVSNDITENKKLKKT